MRRLTYCSLLSLVVAMLFSVTVFAASEITAEKAKEIALSKVGGGTVVECKLDYEHGKQVYEIEIRYNGRKYEVDVDVATGNIVKYEIDD
ncbi:hypothetical protein FACS1894167_14420 [Synergistales bacterium]|nr:hypothetical protein FACS1894167_14420 [Synergistales bacterium]